MGAIANIAILDGQASPVSKTFNPVNIKNDVAMYADRSGGISLGNAAITISVRQPTSKSRLWKVTAKVVTPVLEVTAPSTATGIQPAPTLAYNLISYHEFVLPERSTLAERKNILAFAKNLLGHAVMTSAVHDLESVY